MSSDQTSASSRRIISRSRHDDSSDSRSHRTSTTTSTKTSSIIENKLSEKIDQNKIEIQETLTTNLDVSLSLSCHQQQQQHNLAISYINKEPYNEDIEIEDANLINELKWRGSVIDKLRDKIAEIKSLKLDNSQTQGLSPLIVTAYRQGIFLWASIKKLNRISNFRVNKARNTTHEEKNKIDEFHLELQNLLYEISHLQTETNKCLAFRSADEDINLIDLESFYAQAPLEVSQPEVTRQAENEHKLRLARLDWELTERQMMLGKIKELERQIDVRESELKAKQNKLESLNPKLNQILEACKPTLEYFNTSLSESVMFSESVQLLPKPLYYLYMMMTAHRDTLDKDLAIEVCGDLDEAKRYDLSEILSLEDSESESNDEETDNYYKKKKTSKAKSSKKKINIRDKLFSKFPLSCKLIIQIDCYGALTLEFFYLNYLKIVAVRFEFNYVQKDTANLNESIMLRPDTIFHCLYPGDNGVESPNLSNKYLFSNTGIKSFETFMKPIGVAYRWCQVLCGLYYGNKTENKNEKAFVQEIDDKCEVDMVEEVVSDGENEDEPCTDEIDDMFESKNLNESKLIGQILNRVKSRFRARYTLQKTINSTKNLNVNNPRLRIQSSLVSCRESSFDKFAAFTYTQHLLDEPNLHINVTECSFYEILLINSAAKLQAQVAINQDYPRVTPLFAINIHWKQQERNFTNDEAIRDMERELNLYRDNFLPDKESNSKRLRRSLSKLTVEEKNYELFNKQICHLLVCFDIYLESESYYLQDNEYQRMKLFPQTVRGRDRKRPYSYMASKDMFVQRMIVNETDEN